MEKEKTLIEVDLSKIPKGLRIEDLIKLWIELSKVLGINIIEKNE